MSSMPKGKVARRRVEQPIALLINKSQRIENICVGIQLLVPMDVHSISHYEGTSWHERSIGQGMIFQCLAQRRDCRLELSVIIHK